MTDERIDAIRAKGGRDADDIPYLLKVIDKLEREIKLRESQ